MSAAVLSSQSVPAGDGPTGVGRNLLRFFARRPDFIVLLLAPPVFVAAGLPMVAWAVVAVLWIIQTILQYMIDARVEASSDPRRTILLLSGGALARAWAVATALLVLGLIDERAGLTAVVFTLILFTFYFAARVIGRGLNEAETATEGGK